MDDVTLRYSRLAACFCTTEVFRNRLTHLAVQVTMRSRIHLFGSKYRLGEKDSIVRWIALKALALNWRQTEPELNAQLVEYAGDL